MDEREKFFPRCYFLSGLSPVAGFAPLLLPTVIKEIKEGDIYEATFEDEEPAEIFFLYSQESKGK